MTKELKIGDRLLSPEQGPSVICDADHLGLVGLTCEETGNTYYRKYQEVCTFERLPKLKKKLTTTKAVIRAAIAIAAITALTIAFKY